MTDLLVQLALCSAIVLAFTVVLAIVIVLVRRSGTTPVWPADAAAELEKLEAAYPGSVRGPLAPFPSAAELEKLEAAYPGSVRGPLAPFPSASPEPRTQRIVLPVTPGEWKTDPETNQRVFHRAKLAPNVPTPITVRPQTCAFRPERLIIGGTPSDWVVSDIKVGNRSQFAQAGSIPGECFAAGAMDCSISLDTVQTAMDFVVIAQYIGKDPGGSFFDGAVMGTAAM